MKKNVGELVQKLAFAIDRRLERQRVGDRDAGAAGDEEVRAAAAVPRDPSGPPGSARRRWRRRAESRPTETTRSWCARPADGCRPRSHPAASRAIPPLSPAAWLIARAAVAIAKSAMRMARCDDRLHRIAAASIARPITLRMSTLRRLTSGPQPSSCACSLKRNASAKICSPRQHAMRRGGAMADRWRARRRRHRERQAGEEQEQRRRQAGDEHRVAVEIALRDPRRASTRR